MKIAYYSTNKKAKNKSFKSALLEGQAEDKGLFMPEFIPQFNESELEKIKNESFSKIAFKVLNKFLQNEIPSKELEKIIESALNFEVTIEKLSEDLFILRLDQGPTASFKDFGARVMARVMQYYLQKEKKKIIILTATSGDTGSAVASAFYGLENIKVVLLFPEKEITEIQRKQMTTLGQNVIPIAVQGKFDDCQFMVKKAFADQELKKLNLNSANSINIGRLLPQTTYYVYAYIKLKNLKAERVVFSVPSGNFGNLTAGIIAKFMGLENISFIASTNLNNAFVKFLETREYKPISPSINCISNAMNVGNPSNIARIFDLYGGTITEKGEIIKMPDIQKMRKDIKAFSITDEETLQTIKKVFDKYKTVIEPHGGVAFAGALRYMQSYKKENEKIVVLETAHPAKFKETVERELKIEIKFPEALQKVLYKKEKFYSLKPNYKEFKVFLRKIFLA